MAGDGGQNGEAGLVGVVAMPSSAVEADALALVGPNDLPAACAWPTTENDLAAASCRSVCLTQGSACPMRHGTSALDASQVQSGCSAAPADGAGAQGVHAGTRYRWQVLRKACRIVPHLIWAGDSMDLTACAENQTLQYMVIPSASSSSAASGADWLRRRPRPSVETASLSARDEWCGGWKEMGWSGRCSLLLGFR